MKEIIEFKRQRDLGAIITDTFKFIREEGKHLGLLILKITGPVMLVVIMSYIFYAQSTLGDFNFLIQNLSFSSTMILSAVLLGCSYIAFYALLYATVFGYIKNYIDTKGNVNENDVAHLARSYFWSYTGLNIIVGIIVVLGLVLCFLPGIYLGVCLSLSYPILMMERKDLGNAISNSFKVIKNEWWITFATLIVVYILYYIIALIFQLPQIIYYLTRMFTMMNEVSMNPYDNVDWIAITLDIISMLAQFFLMAMLLIAISFIYFHLNEKKNFTGTFETIDNLGESES